MALPDHHSPVSNPICNIDAMVIGASAGGLKVLSVLLPQLPENLVFPVFLLEHQKATGKHYLRSILDKLCPLPILEAEDNTSDA